MPRGDQLTYDDLATFPDDQLRRELIDGELIVSPSPVTRHQRLVGRLFFEFRLALRQDPVGEIFLAPLDVVLSDTNVVEPDLLFVANDQSDIATDKHVVGVPALLIEVVSNARLDRVRKRDLYARFEVPEYWIVDPDADRVEVFQLGLGGYGKPQIFEPGEILSYVRIPGLRLDLDAVFAR